MKLNVDGYGECEVWELPKLTPTEERKWRYVPSIFKHNGRMRVVLAREIIATYTKPGEVILDPMAGIGTTLIEGALLGHDTVGVELEKKNVHITKWNIGRLEKLKTLVKKGKVRVIQGDSRNLSKLLSIKADSLIFSPPYADAKKGVAKPGDCAGRMEKFGLTKGNYHTPGRLRALGAMFGGYSKNKMNVGNRSYGEIEAVLKHDNGKETYLSEMFKIYQECFKVLKAGGRMVLVLGDIIRNKKIVRLDLDTKRMCEAVGFRFVEAKLFKLPTKSFNRLTYELRHPDVDTSLKEYEFIQVYEKPAGGKKRWW